MKSIREQATKMGHSVSGKLHRIADDVFQKNGVDVHLKQYVDDENIVYAVNRFGVLVYIAGDDFCI